jgi:hypothetical protein
MRPAADAALPQQSDPCGTPKGGDVHMMDGWDWVWMPFMMVFWLVVLGAVIYVAVRLANRPPH